MTLRAGVAAVAMLSCLLSTSMADPYPEDKAGKTLSPYFWVENGDPQLDQLPLKSTDVSVVVSGVMADVTVRQRYCNTGSRPISARYVFPASTRAAVHGMTMTVGDHVITAVIKEREAAQKVYQAAKREGKSASLLQQKRPNVFTMDVANVMPGDTIDIELAYSELLVPTKGVYEFVYPTVAGPRYSSMLDAAAGDGERWVKSPYLREGTTTPSKLNIDVTLSTGLPLRDVACCSHKVTTHWEGKSVARIGLDATETNPGNRDYILRYRLAGDRIQSGLMLFEGKYENYFLLLAQPPRRVLPSQIPVREYIFVVDVSGSMRGFPLEVSKTLLRDLIGNLRSTDKFNVVLFAGQSRLMSDTSVAATPAHVADAIRVLDSQRGGGGTELGAALDRALHLPRDRNVSRSVVIITDGYIAAETRAFELIHNTIDKTNVFAFGIGSGVNRFLIEGIAKAGHGEPFIVTEDRYATSAARAFREYIQSPVLTGITFETSGFEVYDVEPGRIADMFAERPVVVCGKWRGARTGTLTVRGTSGDGFYSRTFRVADCRPGGANHALEYLWARSRIARLSDWNFGRPTDKQVEQVTSLGLKHSLLTKYTSFVAVCEKVRNHTGGSDDIAHPSPLPEGVRNSAVGVHNTPEPGLLLLTILAIIVLLLSVLNSRAASAL